MNKYDSSGAIADTVLARHEQNHQFFTAVRSWSPDGKKIAYLCKGRITNLRWRICIASAEGLNPTPLEPRVSSKTNVGQYWRYRIDWSPDAKHLVYVNNRERKDDQLWMCNADGSNPRRLTDAPGTNFAPAWGPAPKP